MDDPWFPDPVELPIDGTLDLHTIAARDTRDLVPEYLDECRRRGILDVRIIHGKGIGVQREIVHRILERHPGVISFGHPSDQGSWGATVVRLAPLAEG
ncbi:MAG: Smr/MutS family protein [Candidatus Krumholzibacteriia bacterium]